MVFEFSKNVVNNNSISNDLAVYACSLIEFGYSVEDNYTSIRLRKIGVGRKECVKD